MISTTNGNRKLVRLTEGNIRNGHIPVTPLRCLLPGDCFGSSRKSGGVGKPIRIYLDGLNETVETDIARDAKTGKPRRQFRGRGWVKTFFKHHKAHGGDFVEFERVDERDYNLRFARPQVHTGEEDNPQVRVAEFFAGIGLVRLAMERGGFNVVFANDIDPDKAKMYKDNFPADEFHLGDIHLLKPEDIPDCDLVTASFPCTDLSIAGAMNGIHCGESSAFWGFMELLDGLGDRRPPLVFLENVPGFLLSHDGRDFESAVLSLNALGYAVDTFMIDASRFVPQSRLRLFVVGKLGEPEAGGFGLAATPLRPEPLVHFIVSHPEIRWNIQALPDPPKRKMALEDLIEPLREDDPAWWSKERADYFVSQFSDRHAAVANKMIAGRSFTYGTAFRRVRKERSMAELRTDGLAGCLRTPRGGSGRQILFKAGKGRYQVRLLTARECARLQGVPDTYRIDVPLNKALFGFGDAVCVPVIEWITRHYLAPAMAAFRTVEPANSFQ